MQKKYPAESFVPSRQIDEFWHNHILSTRYYWHDCFQIFGYYLHHQPALSEENKENLAHAYLKTKAFYLKEFGVYL